MEVTIRQQLTLHLFVKLSLEIDLKLGSLNSLPAEKNNF